MCVPDEEHKSQENELEKLQEKTDILGDIFKFLANFCENSASARILQKELVPHYLQS
jgi:hypothetical protein